MASELAPLRPTPRPAEPGALDLVAAFLAGRTPTTLRAYRQDLADFARFVGASGPGPAVDLLVSGTAGQANRLALGYRAHLSERRLAPATVARRLAALRSLVKLARMLGRVSWSLDVEGPRTEAYRDTRGPGLDGWRALLARARAGATTPKGKRDLALIRLMHDLGLRRGEAVALDVADLDFHGRTVAVIGKGKAEPVRLTLNGPTAAALRDWIEAHPDPRPAAPLFVRLDPGAVAPTRIDADNVARMVRALGRKAGLARGVRPHGLRHQAITRILELTAGNLVAAQKFARHADPKTTQRYDDNRRDVAGQMARLLGEDA